MYRATNEVGDVCAVFIAVHPSVLNPSLYIFSVLVSEQTADGALDFLFFVFSF